MVYFFEEKKFVVACFLLITTNLFDVVDIFLNPIILYVLDINY